MLVLEESIPAHRECTSLVLSSMQRRHTFVKHNPEPLDLVKYTAILGELRCDCCVCGEDDVLVEESDMIIYFALTVEFADLQGTLVDMSFVL